ncbi:D-beta-hydroxybutyrate dehydrogenase [Paramagnetospirillum magnetotacticum MS-1]|uniref:D-beta-hydroxybutyrate dehydrogenase n=1 Tax=Paramagnetospirillum magnetotacticum MS-1 TaxID=272627 RepID=A0A0C2V1R4_PARME|nr:SDR family NAD(P)-dependent oxidoreductase [Paramagnetospirillum magnetotacticum]KIL99026.1 D-beta-hydroxybutyrate dehydrogenase [Paramagnetospirillum magnetotacticum MS-1]
MMGEAKPLAGRHALVTGGGRGIGAAIARQLLSLGAAVTITGRDKGRLEGAAAAMGCHAVAMDVTDASAIQNGFALAAQAQGPITILVNNAGIAKAAPFAKTDLSLWDDILRTDLTGAFLSTQAALPQMLESGWGRVVNVASTAGLTGLAYCAAYCAAKHGLIGLTRALAVELASKPVTVNAVCPGYTETDIVEETISNIVAKTGRSREEALAGLVASNPQKRLIKPEEVAEAVAWLCLPGSSSITGQSIAVAGGELM